MPLFRVSYKDGSTTYYYDRRPTSYSSNGYEATSDLNPTSFEAECFYRAFGYLWPHIFGPGRDPYGFSYVRDDPRNSATVRVYLWEGAEFIVEKCS